MINTPLFPPKVHVSYAALSKQIRSDDFMNFIIKAFDKTYVKEEVLEEGYLYTWQERESIHLEQFQWIKEPIDSFVASFNRIAILLSPIKNKQIFFILS